MVNVFMAYFLLFTSGPTGAHLAYVGRHTQATLWACTWGFFSVGLLRDLICLPRYVREYNATHSYIALLKAEKKQHPNAPAFPWSRKGAMWLSSLYMGVVARYLGRYLTHRAALHEYKILVEGIAAISGATLGTILVGSIGSGRLSGQNLLIAFFTCIASLPVAGNQVWLQASVLLVAAHYGRTWRPDAIELAERRGNYRSRFHTVLQILRLYVVLAAGTGALFLASYHNGRVHVKNLRAYSDAPLETIVDGVIQDQEEKLRELRFPDNDALRNELESSYREVLVGRPNGSKLKWLRRVGLEKIPFRVIVDSIYKRYQREINVLSAAFSQAIGMVQNQGLFETISQVWEPSEEDKLRKALNVLGLEGTPDAGVIHKKFRTLSASFHPDRFVQASQAKQVEAALKYDQIVEAFNYLSKTLH